MCRWLGILFLGVCVGVRADEAANRLTLEGVREFTAAYAAWDGSRFAVAAERFERAAAQAPTSWTNHYWAGVAHFHRMLQLRSLPASRTNEQAAAAAMESALAALGTAVRLEPRQAECHALLGTVYGMKIDGSVLRAVRFGPRVERHRSLAMEHGSGNARVRYLLGMCQFHTARRESGWREALATLLAAEKLYAAEAARPAGPLEPRWGRSSCLAFIGRAHEALGQPREAARYFREALVLHPSDHVARAGLARVASSP